MHVFQLRNSTRLSEKKANGNIVCEQRVWHRERKTVYATQYREKTLETRAAALTPWEVIRVHTIGENANEETLGRKADIMAGVEMHLRIKS